MTLKVFYLCNLCEEQKRPEELLGFEFDSRLPKGSLRTGAPSAEQRHLCRNCANGLASLLISEKVVEWRSNPQ